MRRLILGLMLAVSLVTGSLFAPSVPTAVAAPAAQTQEESQTLPGGACVLLHPVDETGDVQVCHLTYWFRLVLHHYYTITQNGTKIETPEGITMYWDPLGRNTGKNFQKKDDNRDGTRKIPDCDMEN